MGLPQGPAETHARAAPVAAATPIRRCSYQELLGSLAGGLLTFTPRPASGGNFGVNLVYGEMLQALLFSAFPGFLEPVGGHHDTDADLLVFGNRPSEQALDGQ